jgi:peroxiredoxin
LRRFRAADRLEHDLQPGAFAGRKNLTTSVAAVFWTCLTFVFEKNLRTMINMRYALPVGLLTCLAVISSYSQLPTVPEHSTVPTKSRPPEKISQLGDPAPPLTVKEWIKGKPVDFKEGTNIYVVEFWAALSPASRAAIPKLNELHNNFKDKGVVFLGIADDPPDKVKEFMSGIKIEYSVAADDHRKTAKNYLVAFGQNGIPYVFVIGKDGKVVWRGYPLRGLEKALDDIIAGSYDLQKEIRTDAVRAELDNYRILAREGDAKAEELGRKILADRTNDAVQLSEFAYRIVADVNNTNRNFALADEALDQAEKAAHGKAAQVVFTRGVVMFEKGKKEDGLALAKQAITLASNTNEMAAYNLRLNIMEERMKAEEQNKKRAAPEKP